MNELFIYELFKNIIKSSFVLEGRFYVLEEYANNLNMNSFGKAIKDALDSMDSLPQKYPGAFLMPPTEIINGYGNVRGPVEYMLEMYFLTPTYNTGQGETKDRNIKNNTSDHPIKYDWKDMRTAAKGFRKKLNEVSRVNLPRKFGETQKPDLIKRISVSSNDNLSGVYLKFYYHFYMDCENEDYENVDPRDIPLPDIDQLHQQHKHN